MYPDYDFETCEINDTATLLPSWMCTTLDLILQPHDYDGDNVVIDGVDDAIARETIRQQRVESLDFDLNGRWSPEGVYQADQRAGLKANKRRFEQAFYSGFDADGCLDISYVDSEGTWTGRVQPLRLRFSRGLWACTAVLTVRFPEPLTEAGS